jgi:hypothetical protein
MTPTPPNARWIRPFCQRLPLTVGVLAVACWTALPRGWAADKAPAGDPVFEKDVMPIFQAKCLQCHGAAKIKAGLDLRTKAAVLKGGDTGAAVTPGNVSTSLLWDKVSSNRMPPGKVKLTEKEKNIIRDWIDAGAVDNVLAAARAAPLNEREVTDADRQFWSFRPPVRPEVPTVAQAQRVRNPIDAFLLHALEKKGLTFSPEGDRLTLLRRASFELIGLPPSPKEIDTFLADQSPDAYERLIDRLLASENYGERWGRHWLDLAGYADSEGILDADYERTAAWRYRDYVIQAFNKDKPYDRFLKEQLAGDELIDYWKEYQTAKKFEPAVVDALVATGYLRCASDTSRQDFVNIKNAPGYYFQTLDDTVKIVASSTLGLTVECARCHSHKYDPIPQSDYYRVQAIFMSAYRPAQWVPQPERRLREATAFQEKEGIAKVNKAVDKLRAKADDLKKEFAGYLFTGRLGNLPQAIRDDVRVALNTMPQKRNEIQKYLATKFEKDLRPDSNTLDRLLPENFVTYKARAKEIDDAIKAARVMQTSEIRALYDLPGEARTFLLRRGDYLTPGPEVKPGVPALLATPKPFTWTSPGKEAKTSGRRLAFAEWLTQPEHPLTARVLVNRLWLQHFGEGIVSTPDNFGKTGATPSHPELLDWLATEFVARGWSIKTMHRLIMTSSAYRQVATINALGRRVDPEDRLLWRQRLHRLEAETMRDAILTVSGNLNREKFGPPVVVKPAADGEVTPPAGEAGRRRSVYLQVRRSQPVTLLEVFDQPVMATNCTRRGTSTVASQALALLNSDFLISQAETFAARAIDEKPVDPAGYALQAAFGRPPTDKERGQMTAFLSLQTARHAQALGGEGQEAQARRKALTDLCHMLLSANEFAYVD